MFVSIFYIFWLSWCFLNFSEIYMLEFNIFSINFVCFIESLMVSASCLKFALFLKGFAFLRSFGFLLMSPIIGIVNVFLMLKIVGYNCRSLISIDISQFRLHSPIRLSISLWIGCWWIFFHIRIRRFAYSIIPCFRCR